MSDGYLAPDQPPESEFLLYQAEDGQTRIECRFEGETIWLTQANIADLHQTTKQNASLHLKNIFEDAELGKGRAVKKYLTTGPDSKKHCANHHDVVRAIHSGLPTYGMRMRNRPNSAVIIAPDRSSASCLSRTRMQTAAC